MVKSRHHLWTTGSGALWGDVGKSHSSVKILASLCLLTPQQLGQVNGPGAASYLGGASALRRSETSTLAKLSFKAFFIGALFSRGIFPCCRGVKNILREVGLGVSIGKGD